MAVIRIIAIVILVALAVHGFWFFDQSPEHTDYLIHRDNQWYIWKNGYRFRKAVDISVSALHGDLLYGAYLATDDAIAWCDNYSNALEKPKDARIYIIYANGHILNLTHRIRTRLGANDHANVVAYGNHVVLNVEYFDDCDKPVTYGYCQLYRIGPKKTVTLLKTISNASGTVDAGSFRTIDVNGDVKLWTLDGRLVRTNLTGKLTIPIRCRYYNSVWYIYGKHGLWIYDELSKRLVEMNNDFSVGSQEVLLPNIIVSKYDMLGHAINCVDEYALDGKLRKSYWSMYQSSMYPVSRNFMKAFANANQHAFPDGRQRHTDR